jgi:hypothetical protein
MARAFALAASQIDHADWVRNLIVCTCALTLILAGQPLPL